MLGDCYRFKLPVAVTRNGDDRLSMSGLNFLRITAIPGVAGIVPCRRVLFIAKWASISPSSIFSSTWACNCFRNLLTSASVLNWLRNSRYINILTCEKAFKVGSDLIFVVLLDLSVLFQFAKWGKKMYSKDVQQFLCYKVII